MFIAFVNDQLSWVGKPWRDIITEILATLAVNGQSDKTFLNKAIAIIGCIMTGGINDVRDHFQRFWNEVHKTLAFKENKEWIDNLVNEGYNIFDIHDPLGASDSEGFSAFYDMETLTNSDSHLDKHLYEFIVTTLTHVPGLSL